MSGPNGRHPDGAIPLEAELATLGALLLDNSAFIRVKAHVHPDDFDGRGHRAIAGALWNMLSSGQPVDLLTLTEYLRESGKLEDVGGPAAIAALTSAVPTAANVGYYATSVHDAARKRRAQAAVRSAAEIAFSPSRSADDIEAALRRLADVGDGTSDGPRALLPVPLETVRAEQLVRTWFLVDLFTFGLAIIAAKKGNWKSLLALQAAYALAYGRDFLGRAVPKAVRVLYLALELDRIAMSERAQRLGPAPDGLDILFSFSRGGQAVQDLEQLITTYGYRVVFVDMAAAILPPETDGNAYEQVVEFLLQLRRLAQRLECCIALLLHSPKAEKADFADAVLGSVGFGGQADSIIFLDRKRGENVARVFVTGNHGADSTFKIKLGDNLELSLLDDGEPATFLPAEADVALTALRQFSDGASPKMIAQALGKQDQNGKDAVRMGLVRLVDKGFAVKLGRGRYRATSTAQADLEEETNDPFGS